MNTCKLKKRYLRSSNYESDNREEILELDSCHLHKLGFITTQLSVLRLDFNITIPKWLHNKNTTLANCDKIKCEKKTMV